MIEIVPPDLTSPCIGLCIIGEDDRCDGCRRTLDEIARWTTMSAAERTAVFAALPARNQAAAGSAPV